MVMMKTEIGLLPNDWKIIELEDVIDKNDRYAFVGGPFGSNLKTTDYTIEGIQIVQLQNIGDGFFVDDSQVFTSLEKAEQLRSANIYAGDIIISKMGDPVARACFIPKNKKRLLMASDGIRLAVDEKKYNKSFILYVINDRRFRKAADSHGIGSTRKRISLPTLKQLKIPVTALEEQTAIAEALSDADNLIASLEKLIVKKKAIKQGAMQELLTGKKRLPGFSGEWVETTFGKCMERVVGGGTPSRATPLFWGGNIPWATVKDFATFDRQRTQEYISRVGLENSASHLIPKGTPITSTRMGLGRIVIYDVDVAINQDLKALFGTTNCDIAFIVHWFKYNSKLIESLGTGSTVMGIRIEQLVELSIQLPHKEEQTAIAAILSDMDTEIEQLEKKLAKYRLIKQGMMKDLLTGRIRLVETDTKPEKAPKGHNQQYDDAIAITAIVNAFFDDRFILGRVKVQKLLYLLRRKQEADVSAFKKKAAGPYNEEARYKGGESIAIKRGYIAVERNNKGSKFSKGSSIDDALKYVGNMQTEIDWLLDKFRFYNTNKDTNNLEVLATVDMASCELEKSDKVVNLATVKDVIRSNENWAPKLKKTSFSDVAISQAIVESKELFG